MGMVTLGEVYEENKIESGEPPRHYFSAAKVGTRNVHLFRSRPATQLMMLLVFWAVASCACAQVIFNSVSSPVAAKLTTGTDTVTVTQTIPSQSNGLLLICASINNQQSTTSTITSITDNVSSAGIFNVGAVNTNAIKSRVEIWALISPPSGLNTIIITIPVTAPTVGVVAISADFAEVNQTTPFEKDTTGTTFFSSNTATGGGLSPTATLPSAAGDVVIDTAAIGTTVTLTPATGQT